MRHTRNTDCSSKKTVLTSIVLLGLFSWLAFWTYTQVSVYSTQNALSSQLEQQLMYRFDTALSVINQRSNQLQMQTQGLVLPPGTLAISSLEAGLAQLLRGSDDLIGAAYFAGWPAQQARLTLFDDGRRVQTLQQNQEPVWVQHLPDTFIEKAQSGSSWWSPVHRHPRTQAPTVTLVQPLLSSQGKLNGLITLDWDLNAVLALAQAVEATPGTLFWLTDAKGQRFSPAYPDIDQAQKLMRNADAITPLSVFLSGFEHQTLKDVEPPAELYYAPTNSGLRLSVAVPVADANAPLDKLASQQLQYLLYLGAVIVLLTLLGLWRLVPALHNLRASYTDKLTGLPNRLRMMRDLEKNSSVTLVLLNLDRFREVNSLFGDSCGDLILKEVALRLESFLSGTDHTRARLYRVGGDEFALSLPRRRPDIVEQQLEDMLSCIRRTPVVWQNHEIGLSATVGAVVPWLETPQEHSLYIHAREALREARVRGLHGCVYDGSESLEKEFEHNQKWAGKLRDALDTEGLVAWYQPILNNTTGRIDKYECLVRMLDQNGGEVIGPGNFLGVAGKLRLEGHITRVMVEKCFNRFADTGTQFSINLSYSDLLQADLKAFILQRLDETGVGKQVIFELLETANIENYEQVRDFVQEVKKRGCRIAIDDFGTGYSNFEHLLQLQVDFIKIDGSLIRNLDKDPNSRRVARGIVGLARSMKIETVAEYVHSPAIQMEVLRLGISFSQGELIGMPSPELRVEIPSELTRLSYSGRNMARSVLKV